MFRGFECKTKVIELILRKKDYEDKKVFSVVNITFVYKKRLFNLL